MLVPAQHKGAAAASHSAILHGQKPEYTAPDCRLAHPVRERFVYFSGSQYSSKENFGLSHQEIIDQTKRMISASEQELAEESIRELNLDLLRGSYLALRDRLQQIEKHWHDYEELEQIGKELGHIPIMMRGVGEYAPVNYSFRDITASDINLMFVNAPESQAPVREYVKKQLMMREIVAYRQRLVELRNENNKHRHAMVLLNRLLQHVDGIIDANLKSLPEHEEFYYFDTFAGEMAAAIDMIPAKYNKQRVTLANLLQKEARSFEHNNAERMQRLSKALYEYMASVLRDDLKISPSTATVSKMEHIRCQAFMPVLICLNSAYNPYAQNGVFGAEIDSHLHQQALKTYRDHESKAFSDVKINIRDEAPKRFEGKFLYTVEQMSALLFGRANTASQSQSFIGFVARAMIGTLSSTTTTQSRAQAAALPAPASHLMLTWKPDDSSIVFGQDSASSAASSTDADQSDSTSFNPGGL